MFIVRIFPYIIAPPNVNSILLLVGFVLLQCTNPVKHNCLIFTLELGHNFWWGNGSVDVCHCATACHGLLIDIRQLQSCNISNCSMDNPTEVSHKVSTFNFRRLWWRVFQNTQVACENLGRGRRELCWTIHSRKGRPKANTEELLALIIRDQST